MAAMPVARRRDAKGRFAKAPPLSRQQVGDASALQFLEEAEPPHCLALTAVYTVHQDWWQARDATR